MSTSREPKLVLVALMLGIAVASAPWFLGHWTCHGNAITGSVWVFCIVTSLWLKTGKKWLGWLGRGIITLNVLTWWVSEILNKYCNWPELYVCALHFGQDSVLILIQFWWEDDALLLSFGQYFFKRYLDVLESRGATWGMVPQVRRRSSMAFPVGDFFNLQPLWCLAEMT